MADYLPPAGPPPPKVPDGWKAVWNDQYKEWFYVNLHTKQSTWTRPTEPASSSEAPPDGPPAYDESSARPAGAEKSGLHDIKSQYSGTAAANMSEDEKLARQLQEQENARNAAGPSSGGAASDYYSGSGSSPAPYQQQQQTGQDLPARDFGKKGGFLGKLLGKSSKPQYPQQGYGGYPQQGYGQQYPQQGYGGYPPQQGYGYPPQQGYYQQQQQVQPGRRPGGGLGVGGAAALGVGGGLLGGMLLGEAMDGGDGGDGGGDYGGDGGGDFGGGGGDFGGGDGGGGF